MKHAIKRALQFATLFLLTLAFTELAVAVEPAAWLPGDDTTQAAAGDQQAPAIARGGDMLLAVWADRRAVPDGTAFADYETSTDIYAMRLDADGNPIDALPFAVTVGQAAQENPKVAWNGTHWLVVFESYDIGGTGFYYAKSVEAVRVAPTGVIADTSTIKIRNIQPSGVAWAIASDGAGWVIAAQESDSSSALQLLGITADGVVTQPPQVIVPGDYYLRSNMHLAYAGGVYLFSWSDLNDTLALRFDTDLNVLDAAPFVLEENGLSHLTSNGTQFYMVWEEQLPNFTVAVKGTRIDTSGARLDGDGVNISAANQPQAYTTTSVAWDDTYWQVTWGHQDTVRIARVDAAGQVLDPGGVPVSGPETGPTAGTAAGGVQLVWSEFTESQYDVVSANIAAGGAAGTNKTLSLGAPQQFKTDIAVGDGGYMVVYRSDTAGHERIKAQPLDADGNPLTAEPVELDSGPRSNGVGTPAVAWNGSLYLATWSNASGVVARRIDQDGTLHEPAPFFVMDGFGPMGVAAVGDTFLAVGHEFGYSIEIIVPVAARIRGSDGLVLDPGGFAIGGSYAGSLDVTSFDNRWLAVWRRNITHDDPIAYTDAAFIAPDGSTSGAFEVIGPYSTSGGNFIIEVAVAGGAGNALVLQSFESTSGVETDLIGVLVDAAGATQPAVNLTPWLGNQYRPQAAWDGSQFVIVYTEQKNRFAPFTLDQLDARGDLYGMRIDPTGTPVDPQGFAFSTSPMAETHPNLAAADGVTLIAGSVTRGEDYVNYRIGYERLGVGGNQWPVAVAGSDTAGGDLPLDVAFSSAGSGDPDGSIAGYLWDFGDGTTSPEANPMHTYVAPGSYVATLTVTDNGAAQTADTVAVGVSVPNVPPVAIGSADPTSGPAPLYVTFSAEGSYDVDGALGNIEWTFSDGGNYYGSPAYHTFTSPGTQFATLTVFDNRGGTGTTTVFVEVEAPNASPVAVVTADPSGGDAPLTVNFSSAGSSDPDGTIAAYDWAFGDGVTSTEENPSHVYAGAGTYIASLTVTDDRGATDSANATITVTGLCLQDCMRVSHIFLIGRDQGARARIIARTRVVSETGAPVSNALVRITWTLPGGQTQDRSAYTNGSGMAPFNTVGPHGTYTLTVEEVTQIGRVFDLDNSVLTKSITY